MQYTHMSYTDYELNTQKCNYIALQNRLFVLLQIAGFESVTICALNLDYLYYKTQRIDMRLLRI